MRGAKQEFDELFNKEVTSEAEEYVVLPVSDLSEGVLRALEEDIFKKGKNKKRLMRQNKKQPLRYSARAAFSFTFLLTCLC